MEVKALLNDLLAKSNMNKSSLSRELGVSPQAVEYRFRNSRDIRTNSLCELLDLMGYQLVVTNKGAKLPAGSEIITTTPKEDK